MSEASKYLTPVAWKRHGCWHSMRSWGKHHILIVDGWGPKNNIQKYPKISFRGNCPPSIANIYTYRTCAIWTVQEVPIISGSSGTEAARAQILFQSGILIATDWYYAESWRVHWKVVVCNRNRWIGLVPHVLCTIRSEVCTSSCDPSLPLSAKELGNGNGNGILPSAAN